MKQKWILVSAVLILFATVSPVWAAGGHKLTDQELDQVAAGDFNAQFMDGALNLSFDTGDKFKNRITGTGTMAFQAMNLPNPCDQQTCTTTSVINNGSMGIINMTGNAQQNLNSLVNIVAVNSLIQVLTNLQVNIGGSNNTTYQSNNANANGLQIVKSSHP